MKLIIFGVISGGLYILLYIYADRLTLAAERVQSGEMVFASIPVAVAFVFSLAHGKFTAHFWDYFGFHPKK